MGRLKKEPTTVIGIPLDKLAAIEKLLGRKLANNQTPIVKIRVPVSAVGRIRRVISK